MTIITDTAFFADRVQFFGLVFICALFFSLVMTWIVLALALRFGWTAKSNNRSSHVGQLAFGGGASVIGVSLVMWGVLAPPLSPMQWAVFFGAIVLAIISWVDDLTNLPAGLRMLLHVGVVGGSLLVLPRETNILPFELPLFADRILAGFFWLWFINLFNFMDGIDGLAGVETVFIAVGVVAVGVLGGAGVFNNEWVLLALIIAGSTLGFLPWNWHKARIMLGDLGSVPLGFILGFLLILLALEGYWIAALILPAYFVADATITIMRRLLSGEKIWHPHRTHFYQRASSPTSGHDRVVVRVAGLNIVLVVAAIVSIYQPVAAVIMAALAVGILLMLLSKMSKTKQ